MLAAHYDSVLAGPGVSDDGIGVATVLEIARAVKSQPVPRHSIVFLIDDGEEAGLLGARAFVDSDPWAKNIGAAVNLEARGTSGPSLMFETGAANAWAVRLYASSVKSPLTSSIFYTLYKRLPNDTDFTVFKAAGYEGMNFAFIGDVVRSTLPLITSQTQIREVSSIRVTMRCLPFSLSPIPIYLEYHAPRRFTPIFSSKQ